MPEIMIARRPGWVRIDGQRRMVKKGVTTAHADHPIVTDHPRLWEPLAVTYPSPAGAESARLDVTTLEDRNPVTIALDDPEDPVDPDPDPDPEDPEEPPAEPVDPDPGDPPPPGEGRLGRNARIREWAAAAGIEVSPRGKIPAPIIERYEAAHRG